MPVDRIRMLHPHICACAGSALEPNHLQADEEFGGGAVLGVRSSG